MWFGAVGAKLCRSVVLQELSLRPLLYNKVLFLVQAGKERCTKCLELSYTDVHCSQEAGSGFWGQRGRPTRSGDREPLQNSFSTEHLQKSSSELLSHKGVQHRVHAAVQKAKVFSCEHGNVHRHLWETAELNHFGSQERVNYRGNMEGGPAQKKGHNHSYDDLHGSLFLETACTQEPLHCDAVADQHDHQREEEPEQMPHDSRGQSPLVGMINLKAFWANSLIEIFVIICLVVERWQGEHQA